VTKERLPQDPVTQLANNIRGYAQFISGLSESNLAPLAGMAIEGAREWVTGALTNAGGTIAGGAASLEALIPAEIRTIVRQEVESALSGLPGIPSKAMRDELRLAQEKIVNLEAEVKRLRTPAPAAPLKKSSPGQKKSSSAKERLAKKSTAKKSTAKKSTAKKSTAKKSPAKKTTQPTVKEKSA